MLYHYKIQYRLPLKLFAYIYRLMFVAFKTLLINIECRSALCILGCRRFCAECKNNIRNIFFVTMFYVPETRISERHDSDVVYGDSIIFLISLRYTVITL